MFDANDPLLPNVTSPRGDLFRIVVWGLAGAFAVMVFFVLSERFERPQEAYFSDGQAGFGLLMGAIIGWLLGAVFAAGVVLCTSATPVGVGRVLAAIAVILLGTFLIFPVALLFQVPLVMLDGFLTGVMGSSGALNR